jgi:predicted nucleotidyltransferase
MGKKWCLTLFLSKDLHMSQKSSTFAGAKVFESYMNNDSNILSQIQTLGKKVLPKGSSVLLYGSRARGDNREDSDYDLVVLVDKDKQQLQDFTDFAYPFMEMGWNLGAEINPMLYTRKEWSERHFTPFYKNVEHDKIVLV